MSLLYFIISYFLIIFVCLIMALLSEVYLDYITRDNKV